MINGLFFINYDTDIVKYFIRLHQLYCLQIRLLISIKRYLDTQTFILQ